MAQRQLNIRSDEAAQIASDLAKRLGKTTTDVVVEALRAFRSKSETRDEKGMTAEQRRRYEAIRAAAREAARHKPAGVTSEHDWLYDEHGLPK